MIFLSSSERLMGAVDFKLPVIRRGGDGTAIDEGVRGYEIPCSSSRI